ncbi:hypothetical protein Mapa_005054 [Marchantia paleacea]|nr:hypothetical protein Mapa_005054 [Marchantia paleacea]
MVLQTMWKHPRIPSHPRDGGNRIVYVSASSSSGSTDRAGRTCSSNMQRVPPTERVDDQRMTTSMFCGGRGSRVHQAGLTCPKEFLCAGQACKAGISWMDFKVHDLPDRRWLDRGPGRLTPSDQIIKRSRTLHKQLTSWIPLLFPWQGCKLSLFLMRLPIMKLLPFQLAELSRSNIVQENAPFTREGGTPVTGDQC